MKWQAATSEHTGPAVPVAVDGSKPSQVAVTLVATEEALMQARNTIGEVAKDEKADAAQLAEVRALHRRAKLRWDFISPEGSTGFHNPEEALRISG